MPVCASCGAENPERAKFCLECGAALQAGLPLAAEERKVVSVLFCDLVGFTAHSEAADPEDVRARIRPYHERLREEIERYGGTVEKFVGDAVMAVFGAPTAHEDDAERAVRAGLRILEAIEELNESDPGLGLQVRIGINTGEAVVALGARPERGEGIVTGDVVNTASRLQSAAPVGCVVVGETTYGATRRIFDFDELEPVALKGKTRPVPLWRARAARARFGTDLTRTHAGPLVGREVEQTLLQSLFERAVRDRSVQLVTIVGEPGVGKSRLVAELFAFVDERSELVRWRQGRCLPYGEGITFWALGEIVKAEAGILESDSPDQAAAKLDATLSADEPDREWLRARLGPLVGIDSGLAVEREEAFTAWRRFLEALAGDGPAVLVFEDLHWADEALLAFLEHLAEWSEGVPLLIVGTTRPELYERHAAWVGGTRNATTINLTPLSDDETARLVSALLDVALLPAEVQSLLLERAGGNPLYAEEFVRMLNDRGLLVRTGRSLSLRAGSEIPAPESIQALIAARLDTLPAERKALLQDAAVIGKVFWAGAVASMGGREERDLREALHELSRKELVRPARVSSMAAEAEYAFWHALVRDVCYAQIPRAARAGKHRAAATWLEQQAGERVEDLADVLAHHYLQALELARAVGQTDDAASLEPAARRFLVLAGARAMALDAAQAEAHYAQALELTAHDDPTRAEILESRAHALRQAGRTAEAAAALEEAIMGFREQGNTLALGQALYVLAGVLGNMGDSRRDQVITEAVAVLEREIPGPELIAGYGQMALFRFLHGANEEALSWAERSLALAAELGLEQSASALSTRGLARIGLGEVGGLADLRRVLYLSIESGLGRDAAQLYNNLAMTEWVVEGPAKALETCRAGVDFCERRGIADWSRAIVGSSLDLLIQLGEWDEAVGLAESLVVSAEAAGATLDLIEARRSLATVFAYRGEQARAASADADWLVAAARDSGEPQMIASAFGPAALAHLTVGESERARALLAELGGTPGVDATWWYPAFLPQLVRSALACGDSQLAHELAQGIEPRTPFLRHAFCASRAALAEAAGELDDATSLYAKAAEGLASFAVVPEKGFALLGQGRCLISLGRPGYDAPLQEAREIFARLRARPLIAAVDDLLAGAIARTS